MSNAVPDEWSVGTLTDFSDINPRLAQRSEMNADTHVSFIKMEDVSNNAVVRNIRTASYGQVSKGFTSFQNGDVLVAKITPCFENGKGGFVQGLRNGVGFGSTEFHVLRARKNSSPKFLYQFTNSEDFRLKGAANMTGSAGQRRVPTEYLKSLDVAFPPLPEQQKIAAILSSVDDVIEKARAQIDKLKDLKTGMMQELLTKGIGSGGVPHTEFKDSPVGRIPASWSVARLDALAKVGSSKRIRESEYVTEGVPFFRSKEVIRRSKGLDIEKTLYISKQRFTEISEKFGAPKQGDILITAVGTIGVVYLVEDREFYFKDGNLLWLRNIRPAVSSQYLAKIMASEGFQAEIDRVTGGSSQAALTIEKLQELTVVVPPLEEQEGIVGILRSLDEKYQATYQKLLLLKDLKKALMQDLFTGKVRVKVDQKESAVA